MENGKYYVLGYGNNLYEGLTKEQVIAAIAEATGETPTDVDAAFITKIKELNKNQNLKFWIGTTAEYNALGEYEPNCFYIFSDSTELEEIIEAAKDAAEAKANEVCEAMQDDVEQLQTDVAQAQSDIADIQNTLALKGAVLCEDSVNTPPSLTGKVVTNIDKYSIVAVNIMGAGLVLCSVEQKTIDGVLSYEILGVGTGILTSQSSIWRVTVEITINANTKTVSGVDCVTAIQIGTTLNNPATAYASKIIGIV